MKVKINYSADSPTIEINFIHSPYLLEVIRVTAGVLIIIPDVILMMNETFKKLAAIGRYAYTNL